MNQRLRYNLQFHAGDGDGSDNTGDGDDNQDNQEEEQDDEDSSDEPEKSDKKGKYYTQEDIDEMITKRLERERKRQEKKQKAKDDKKGDKKPEDKSESNNKKLSELETKVLCYDHDIAKEYVKESIALAKAYMDEDTDMDEALEKVTEKFPQFVKGYKADKEDEEDNEEEESKKAWGKRQNKSPKKGKTLEDEIEEQLFGRKDD